MVIGALDGSVEAAAAQIFFDLPIPLICRKLREPLGETSKFRWGKV
jgi:hypothetical protein